MTGVSLRPTTLVFTVLTVYIEFIHVEIFNNLLINQTYNIKSSLIISVPLWWLGLATPRKITNQTSQMTPTQNPFSYVQGHPPSLGIRISALISVSICPRVRPNRFCQAVSGCLSIGWRYPQLLTNCAQSAEREAAGPSAFILTPPSTKKRDLLRSPKNRSMFARLSGARRRRNISVKVCCPIFNIGNVAPNLLVTFNWLSNSALDIVSSFAHNTAQFFGFEGLVGGRQCDLDLLLLGDMQDCLRALKSVERSLKRDDFNVQKVIGRKISPRRPRCVTSGVFVFLPQYLSSSFLFSRGLRVIYFCIRSKMHNLKTESNRLFTRRYAALEVFWFFANWLLFDDQQSLDDFELRTKLSFTAVAPMTASEATVPSPPMKKLSRSRFGRRTIANQITLQYKAIHERNTSRIERNRSHSQSNCGCAAISGFWPTCHRVDRGIGPRAFCPSGYVWRDIDTYPLDYACMYQCCVNRW